MMASLEERVSRLEASQEHLATKADVAEVKTEIANVRSDLANTKVEIIKWMFGIGLGVVALNSSITLAALRLMS